VNDSPTTFLAKTAAYTPTSLKFPPFQAVSILQIDFLTAPKCKVIYEIILVGSTSPKKSAISYTSVFPYKH